MANINILNPNMGLFNRKKPNSNVEERSTTQTVTLVANSVESSDNANGYTMPMSLSFNSSLGATVNPVQLSAVYGSLEMISNKIASIPIVVKTKDGEVVEHPFNKVFDNTICTKFITIKQLVWDSLLYGNGLCYIERDKTGRPTKLVYMPQGTYSIMYNQMERTLYYLIPSISSKKIEPINVIHVYKNSLDGVVGKPFSYYAKKALQLASAAEKTALNFFDSGCALSGIIKSNKTLSQQQKIDIKNSWREAHVQGSPDGLAVLGNDLDFIEIGSNASESQLLESRKYSVKEIARFFGILPELLGDETSHSYNSVSEALNALVTFTLEPIIMVLQDEFNRKCLLPSERSLFTIDFTEEVLKHQDETAQAQTLNSLVAAGIMTPNECRAKLGLPPVEGGDGLRQQDETDTDINTDEI